MALVGEIPGFVVTPPHLALCTLIRILTSNRSGQSFQPNVELATNLGSFLIRQVSQDDLHFPSLSGLLSQLRDHLGEDGDAIGNFCRETLAGLCTVAGLTRFINSLKGDLEGKNGSSNLQRRILPKGQANKLSRHSVYGLFFRNCIVSFEEMDFIQICSLADEVKEYCPEMLDQDPQSVYLNDHDRLESHVDDLLRETERGRIPDSLEQDLKDLDSVSEFFPRPALVKHEVAILQREVTNAFDFLRKFCNRSMHSGSSFIISENPASDRPVNTIHTLMLKMASTHLNFGHIETSMRILEEAFESAKTCNDDGILQSCLVVLLQVLIQAPPSVLHSAKLPVRKEELSQFIDQSLRRCEQKAIEMKTPHILAFCQICRSTLGVKRHLIDNHLASPDETCKMTGIGVQVLTRLRSFVSTGSIASNLKTYINNENEPGVLHSLFDSALEIFGPSVKDSSEAIEATVQQSLASGVLLSSLAWKSRGYGSLSGVLALSVEAVHPDDCKVSDRAAALGQLAIMEANSKGVEHGMKILSYAKQIPGLFNEISLKIAEEYIQLGQHLWTAPSRHQWDEIQQKSEALAAVNSHSCLTCLESQFMSEIHATRALLALNKTDVARDEITRLIELQGDLGIQVFKLEIDLLHLDIQDQLGILDMKITEFLQDLSQRQSNPVAVVLFCKTLMKLEDNSNEVITKMLKSVLPAVLREGSIIFQTGFLLFLIDFMLITPGQQSSKNRIKVLVSLIKHGVDLSSRLKNVYFLKEFFKKNDQLHKLYSDQQHKDETILELESICRRNGTMRSQVPSLMKREDRDDVMEVD